MVRTCKHHAVNTNNRIPIRWSIKDTRARNLNWRRRKRKSTMRSKHILTHKLNSKIYTLRKWIRRNQMYPIAPDWEGSKEEQKTPKGANNQNRAKNRNKTTISRIRKSDAKLREINQNLQQLRNNWSARKDKT